VWNTSSFVILTAAYSIQPYFVLYNTAVFCIIYRAVDASVRRVDRARAPAPWLTGCSPTLAQLGRS
jgi:hypothetical protein